MLQYRSPSQSSVSSYFSLIALIRWFMSSLHVYFTPKLSTTRVNEMDRVVCFQRPGVFWIHGTRGGKGVFSGVCLPIYQPGGGHKLHVIFPGICVHCVSCLYGHIARRSMGGKGQKGCTCICIDRGGPKGRFFMSRHIYFGSGVLSTLFQCSFEVVMSAVHVVSSPG